MRWKSDHYLKLFLLKEMKFGIIMVLAYDNGLIHDDFRGDVKIHCSQTRTLATGRW